MVSKEYFVKELTAITTLVEIIETLTDSIGLSLEGNLYNCCYDLIDILEEKCEDTSLIGDWIWENKCGTAWKNSRGEKVPLITIGCKEYYPKTPEELYDTLTDLHLHMATTMDKLT